MALFRRGKDSAPAQEDPAAEPATPAKDHGPWDVAEVSGPDGRLDLGSLWVPGLQGMELRLEIDQSDGNVVGVTVVLGDSSLQLQAFAAPRSLGIWDDIRDEITHAIRTSGGRADVVDGRFGTQIDARLTQTDPRGHAVLAPVVFMGVDGPRWFLRGFLSGPAVDHEEIAEPLLSLFADTVVIRGAQAMAPRDLLPLRLPAELAQAQEEAAQQAGHHHHHSHAGHHHHAHAGHDEATGHGEDLKPFERGPEITEVR